MMMSEESKQDTTAVPATMRAVVVEKPGPPGCMTVSETVPTPVVGEEEVLIKVAFTALNRADTLQRMGKYPPPKGASEVMGLEAAGTVAAIGAGCTRTDFKVGDRVMALLPGGGYAEYAAVNEHSVMVVPEAMSLEVAGGVPETWLTAFQLLQIARLGEGESVLIHAGASGVGTAAIQLAKHVFGAKRIIVSVGSTEKIDYCKGLGATDGVVYKTEPFGDAVLKFTEDAGVDVILDCVGAAHCEQNMKCVALDGRWVLFGLMGGAVVDQFSMRGLLRRRVHLMASTLRTRTIQYKAALTADFVKRALPALAKGDMKVVIERVFPFDQIVEAHELMHSNTTRGKIVVRVQDVE